MCPRPTTIASELSRNDRFQERFRREGRSQAALDHPHVVTVHDFGEAKLPDGSECTFIVTELIDGVTLRTMINDTTVPRRDLLRYCAQVAEGLAKAHSAGIVHRDLKPDNVMVSSASAIGRMIRTTRLRSSSPRWMSSFRLGPRTSCIEM